MGEDRFKFVLGVDLILENEYKTTQNFRSLDLLFLFWNKWIKKEWWRQGSSAIYSFSPGTLFVLSNVMHRTVSFVVDISSEFLCLSSGPGNYFQCRLMENRGCSLLQRYDKNISLLTPSGLFHLLKAFSTGHISTSFPWSAIETLKTRLVLFSGAIGQF